MRSTILDERLEDLMLVADVQANKYDEDEYQHGLANGLLLASSIMTGDSFKPMKPKTYKLKRLAKR
jgi:hypothetical protein